MSSKLKPMALEKGLHDLGMHVAHWRKLLNLSIKDLARRSEVSESTIMRLERGETVSTENVMRVLLRLGILQQFVSSIDPFQHERGKLLLSALLPERAGRR